MADGAQNEETANLLVAGKTSFKSLLLYIAKNSSSCTWWINWVWE